MCTEPEFDNRSILLARSIRRFAGRFRQVPIYSFSPRKAQRISRAAVRELERLDVIVDETTLNVRHPDDGLANKPIVCAHAEETVAAQLLAFIDSDTVILNEPTHFELDADTIIAVRPTHGQGIGVSTLHGGVNETYWSKLYSICGVRTLRYMPMPARRWILEYFNSGLFSIRPEYRLLRSWGRNFDAVTESGLAPVDPYFIEQSTFSATVSAAGGPVSILPQTYNFLWSGGRQGRRYRPLGAGAGQNRQLQLHQLVTIHYHNAFSNGDWRRALANPTRLERMSEQYEWLIENLSQLDFDRPGMSPPKTSL
jgi:hypothetical protein